MKFKINYSAPTDLDHYLYHSQNIHNTQVNYISRGENRSLADLLRSLQNIFMHEDHEDQNLMLMMEMDQEFGGISIGLMKRSTEQKANKYKPDPQSTLAVIMQYEDSQTEMSRSLRQNLMLVTRNKLLYKKSMEQIDRWSIYAQANKTIKSILPITQEQPLFIKNRTFSQETHQHSQVEYPPAKQFKSAPIDTHIAQEQERYLQFQQFEACPFD